MASALRGHAAFTTDPKTCSPKAESMAHGDVETLIEIVFRRQSELRGVLGQTGMEEVLVDRTGP